MDRVIRARRPVADRWQLLDDAAAASAPSTGALIVPAARFTGVRAARGHEAPLGLWLAPADDPAVHADDIAAADIVCVQFPTAADGRGHSLARLLRDRLGYRGELRAFGAVRRDHLAFLERSGFDSFALVEGDDPAAALAAFDELPDLHGWRYVRRATIGTAGAVEP